MNELVSLSELFNNKIFRIPDYQRGYAWNIEQLTDFWDDIMTLSIDRYHYTGMISLKKLKPNDYSKWDNEKWLLDRTDNPYEAYHIVDGQQRLTTFIILINEILQFVININQIQNKTIKDISLNGTTLEAIITKYIKETRKSLIAKATYKFGYEIDNPSFLFMKHQILGEINGGTLEETFYTLNLQKAKNFFVERIQDLYSRKGFESLEELFIKLTEKLKFNIHNIDDEFDVFVAFETMNNRGKKLSNLELLKNRLIYLTTLYPDTHLSTFDKSDLRNEINDAWKEIYKQLGRNKEHPLNDDEFLRAHWTMFFKYSRNKGDDYIKDLLGKKFNPKHVMQYSDEYIGLDENSETGAFDEDGFALTDKFDDDLLEPVEIKEYVGSLKSLAQYWFYTFNPRLNSDLDDDEKVWIERLNRIGINSFRTLVASTLFNNHSSNERVNLFRAMERFIFICFRLGGFNASYKNTDFFKYAREQFLHRGKNSIEDITKYINNLTNVNIKEATTKFKIRVDSWIKYDGYYSWDYLKYFLFEYEYDKIKLTGIKKFDWDFFSKSEKDKVSIEHIFPQTPTKWYWANLYRQFTKEEKTILSGSLGNLLPLSQSINSSLQNDEFELKKNPINKQRLGYSNNSYSAIEISYHSDWSAKNIFNRGLELLCFMENRWDFKFESEEFKISLLNINFIDDNREIPNELEKIEEKEIVNAPKNTANFYKNTYWREFISFCDIHNQLEYTSSSAGNRSYYTVRFNSGFNYAFKVNKKVIELELYCWDNENYLKIKGCKDELETALNQKMKWDISKESSTAKRAVLENQIDYTDKNNWETCFVWYLEKIKIVSEVLNKYYEINDGRRIVRNRSERIGSDQYLLDNTNHRFYNQLKYFYDNIPSIDSNIKSYALDFKVNFLIKNRIFTSLYLRKNNLYIEVVATDDTRGILEKVPDNFCWTQNGKIYVDESTNLNDVLDLITISYYEILNSKDKDENINTEVIKLFVENKILEAKSNHQESIIIISGEIKKSFNNSDGKMPMICSAMRSLTEKYKAEVLGQSPSGYSSTLTIEYFIE